MRNRTTLASILFFMISFVSVAQGIGDNPPPPMPPPPPGLPIDGVFCTIVLICVGLYFGSKKVLSLEKK